MSSRAKFRTISPIAYDILGYLVDHPAAQDTLEGILEWWLLEQEIKRRTAEVKAALASLVAEGLILEQQGKDRRLRYRINRSKREEILVLVSTRKKEGS